MFWDTMAGEPGGGAGIVSQNIVFFVFFGSGPGAQAKPQARELVRRPEGRQDGVYVLLMRWSVCATDAGHTFSSFTVR